MTFVPVPWPILPRGLAGASRPHLTGSGPWRGLGGWGTTIESIVPTKGPFSAGGKKLFLVRSRQGVDQLHGPPCLVHPLEGATSGPNCWREVEARVRRGQLQGSPGPHLPWRPAGMLKTLTESGATSVPPSSPFPRNGRRRGYPILQAQLGSSLVARGYRSWALAVSMTTTGCSVLLWPPQL